MKIRIRADYLPAILLLSALLLSAESPAGDCFDNGSVDEQLTLAREQAVKKFDPDSLACASLIFARIAQQNKTDLDLHVEAMNVMEESLFFLRMIQTLDLMGVDQKNTDRISSIGKTYSETSDSANRLAADDPRVMAHTGLAAKESSGSYDTGLLQQAIDKQADVLSGLVQVRMGRLLFELPSILGGDFQVAISLFEQAVEIDAKNMQALYYLAEVYEQELEEEKAAAVMARMLEVDPVYAQLQMSADMLRLAIGLSQRMGKNELSKKLLQKRQAIISEYPQLMTRASIAVGGHGGEHPLTGR